MTIHRTEVSGDGTEHSRVAPCFADETRGYLFAPFGVYAVYIMLFSVACDAGLVGEICSPHQSASERARSRPRKLRIARPRVKHAVSFALLLVLSKPKRCFGFVRRNGGANVKLSGQAGKRNGASPFGRYPLPRSSFQIRNSVSNLVMERQLPPPEGEALGRCGAQPRVLEPKPSAAGSVRSGRTEEWM